MSSFLQNLYREIDTEYRNDPFRLQMLNTGIPHPFFHPENEITTDTVQLWYKKEKDITLVCDTLKSCIVHIFLDDEEKSACFLIKSKEIQSCKRLTESLTQILFHEV
jgi:hypothetical protein